MGIFSQYLGNLHEYFEIKIEEKSLWNGLKKNRDELFQTELAGIPGDYKGKISLKGHAGMISCGDEGSNSSLDENGMPLPEMIGCTIKIIEGINTGEKEYFLTAKLTAEKKNASKMLNALNYFLENNILLSAA
jgi:hypothetical protein